MLLNLVILGTFVVVGVTAALVSILMLRRGRFYQWLKPKSRPRRWVLILLLIMFAAFLAWFPIWMLWPDAPGSRILTSIFLATFFVGGLTLKSFSPLVDLFVKRKGWPLR
jgi:hypothetical protein